MPIFNIKKGRLSAFFFRFYASYSDNIGVPADGPLKEDFGRYDVTKNDADKGAFKTPTLRNITESAPYMHNGFFPTLFEVVQFYNGGGGRSENKSPDIHGLNLTAQEVNDLTEFFKTLTG